MGNRKKIVLCVLMALVMLMTVACSTINNNKPQNEDKSFDVIYHNQKIDNVDISENWLNNTTDDNSLTLSDTDKVNVIIEVEGESLLDRYLSQNSYIEMKDYVISDAGDKAVRELTEIQNSVKELIEALEYEIDYGFTYTALFNGFSATVNYGDIEKLEELQVINRVVVCEEYAVPSVVDITDIEDAMQKTGLFTNETDYHGEGMLVAILDSGLDYNHPAFSHAVENPAINKEYIEKLTASLYGNKDAINYSQDDFYKSTKVPFQFDYAMNDADVMPKEKVVNSYGGYHGTHVAGIIAGYDTENNIISAAYNAQLAIMKVFPDSNKGAGTAVLAAALSDCAVLGVDVINMSLGTPAGFTYERDSDKNYVNELYELLEKLGISISVSSGNSYSQAVINKAGGIDPSNPDSGFVGSPSTYFASLSVASINAYPVAWFFNGNTKVYMKSAVNSDGESYNCDSMLLKEKESVILNLIPVPNAGEESDYNGLDVTGKTVLVQRGGISFEDKQKIAAKMGAIACVIYNNEEMALFGAKIAELVIPTFSIPMEYGTELINQYQESGKAELTLNKFNNNYSMSDFSSWGCRSDLSLKPEITAPGGNIYSTMPLSYKAGPYAYLSGTSMAAPNFAAVNTVIRQYLKENFPSLTNKEIRTLSYQLLMSTTNLAVDDYGVIVSPRKQGAGVADVNAAVNTKAYLTVTGSDRTKLELGDDKNRDGIYTLDFNLVNFDTRALSYDINAIVMTETVVNGLTAERGHLFTDRKLNISAKNAAINGTVVTVEAGNTAKLTITITLTEEEKAYLDELFVNGMYVEGFATLTAIEEDSEDLSIPFLAFYGDWTDAPIFDKTIFENEDAYINEIVVVGNYNYGYRMGAYNYRLSEGMEIVPNVKEKMAITLNRKGNYMIFTIRLTLLRNAKELNYTIYDETSGTVYYRAYANNIRKAYFENGKLYVTQHGLNIDFTNFNLLNNQNLILEVSAKLDYGKTEKTESLLFPIFIDCEKPKAISSKLREENGRTYVDVEVYDNHMVQDYFIGTMASNGTVKTMGSAIPIYPKDWKFNENNIITMDITNYIGQFNDNTIGIALEDCAYNVSGFYLLDYTDSNNNNADENNSNAINYVSSNSENNQEHNFTIENNILTKYEGIGGDIVIPDGVVEIADKVFFNNKTITKVTMPEGMKTIGVYSFGFCSYITEVKLPTTLEVIKEGAFKGCKRIERINFQDTNLYNIALYSFYGCQSIEELIFPASTVKALTIGTHAFTGILNCKTLIFNGDINAISIGFKGLPLLKEIIFNANVNSIAFDSFLGLDSLEKVIFKGDVKKLGSANKIAIFSDCPVQRVEFFGNVDLISSYVFSNCPNLTEVIFHKELKNIDKTRAFGGSYKLTKFMVSEDNELMYVDNNTGIMFNKANNTYMFMPSEWTFEGKLEIPATITKLLKNQFTYTDTIVDNYSYMLSANDFESNFLDSYEVIPNPGHSIDITEVVMNNSIKEIPDRAFSDLQSLAVISNYDGVQKIGKYAFQNCIKLNNIAFKNINTLNEGAFFNCTALTEFIMPDTIKSWYKKSFENCTALKSVKLSNNSVTIPDYAFYKCTELSAINTPSKLKSIGTYAFAETGIEKFEFVASLINFKPKTTFINCSKLKEFIVAEDNPLYMSKDGVIYNKAMDTLVLYPVGKADESYKLNDTIKLIGEGAFLTSTYLKTLDINNVEEILDSAFMMSSIETILNNNLIKINDYAFADSCIKSIDINSCKFIGNSGFRNAVDLTEINLNKMSVIVDYAFCNTGLKNITLSDNIEYIEYGAFADCVSLSSVTIKKNCAKFEYSFAFMGSNIREIIIEEGNKSFVLENGILYNEDKEIIFDYIGSETGKLVIAEGVRKISAYAFMNSSITEVEMPKSLEVISEKAFYGIETLKTFIFHSKKAPRLECQYNRKDATCYYGNFITEIEKLAENNVELTMYHPADTSYHNYLYEKYFANRYEESEEGYTKLNVKVSDVNNMMEEVANGNTALIEEASKLYSMMTETQKSCVNNSEMLSISDMALAVKANDNVYIVIAALFSSLVAFAVIAIKKR